MFKRASSRLVRTGSKDSKDSDISAVANDAMVRIGRATKTGTMHANEDRSSVVETLNDVLDEEVFTVSEMLEFDLKNSGDLLEKVMFAGVFDGHGGSSCASYISKNLHQKIAKNLESASIETLLDAQMPAVVAKSFQEVEEDFTAVALAQGETSGSCAAIAMISGQDIVLAHSGDCRIVIRNCGETLVVTKDHRVDDPIESARILGNGGVIVDGRLNGVLCPSRSFGDLDVKSLSKENVLICTPDVGRYSVDLGAPGKISSFMIIATDGLWDVMDVDEACNFVEKVLRRTGSADVAAARLVETAGKHNYDDVTVIIVAWQRLKPAKEGSKANLKAYNREASSYGLRDGSKDDEITDISQLASPKVSRKKADPDSKLLKKL
jgi:serine/threonine protein phosphatase PrpC